MKIDNHIPTYIFDFKRHLPSLMCCPPRKCLDFKMLGNTSQVDVFARVYIGLSGFLPPSSSKQARLMKVMKDRKLRTTLWQATSGDLEDFPVWRKLGSSLITTIILPTNGPRVPYKFTRILYYNTRQLNHVFYAHTYIYTCLQVFDLRTHVGQWLYWSL